MQWSNGGCATNVLRFKEVSQRTNETEGGRETATERSGESSLLRRRQEYYLGGEKKHGIF
jgi:hypothetical protein